MLSAKFILTQNFVTRDAHFSLIITEKYSLAVFENNLYLYQYVSAVDDK